MSAGAVLKELAGIYPSDATGAATDVQDVFSDDVWVADVVADAAAGTDYTYASIKAPFALQIVDVVVGPGGALTGATATANTYTLGKSDGLGGSITSMATLVTTTGNDWVADVFKSFTLSTVQGALNVTRGQLITLKKTHASTGTVTPQSTFTIKFRRI
jgi:hypothetical protein